MVHQEKQYKFYNHNLSSLFQYLCITLVIKKLYEFEISTLNDFLILFIKLNTNFLTVFYIGHLRHHKEMVRLNGWTKMALTEKFWWTTWEILLAWIFLLMVSK